MAPVGGVRADPGGRRVRGALIMRARIRVAGGAIALAAALFACSDPPPDLPPARIEARDKALLEVRARLAELPAADAAKAAALTHHADHRVRRAAALRLMEMGPAAAPALGDLEALLKDKEPRVRTAAARALAETGSKDAVDPLITGLVDGDRQVRLWCWKSLREIGDQTIPAIADMLGKDNRMRTLSYRDETGRKRTAREELIDRLASIGAAAVEPLAAKLNVEDPQLRGSLLKVFGAMGAQARAALPGVIALLDGSDDADMRIRAIQAIEKIGDLDPGVVPALKRAAADKDKKVAAQAKKTIRALEKAAKAKPKPKEKQKPKPNPKKNKGRPLPDPSSHPQEPGLDPMDDLGL